MSYTQYSQYGGNPYNNAPSAEAGQAELNNLSQEQSGLRPQDSNYSQTSQYSNAGVAPSPAGVAPSPAGTSTLLSQPAFLERVEYARGEIRSLTSSIQEIASYHQRALSSPDSSSSAQLENLVVQTQLKNTQIKDQIKFLEHDAVKTQDGTKSVKARQAKQLKNDFEKALEDYRQEELSYRQRYRDQIARQYRIVNPEASAEEVEEASQLDWGSEGVFQTALKSNRSGQATSVLGAVRARHNELQRIEATLTELAAMFTDLAQVVEAQDPAVGYIEENAQQTNEDVKNAGNQIEKANEHARRRNKLKWYCLLVVVLIVLAIALGIGLGIGLQKAGNK